MASRLLTDFRGVAGAIERMLRNSKASSASPAGETLTPCTATQSASYTIAADGRSITFSPCGITSHNPNDLAHRYCGLCHRFIGDSPDSTKSQPL
jgi:hypothetical protein